MCTRCEKFARARGIDVMASTRACADLMFPSHLCCFFTDVKRHLPPHHHVLNACGLAAGWVVGACELGTGMGLMPATMDRAVRFIRPCLRWRHFGRLSIATRFKFCDVVSNS